jgi:hypothetical protein
MNFGTSIKNKTASIDHHDVENANPLYLTTPEPDTQHLTTRLNNGKHQAPRRFPIKFSTESTIKKTTTGLTGSANRTLVAWPKRGSLSFKAATLLLF